MNQGEIKRWLHEPEWSIYEQALKMLTENQSHLAEVEARGAFALDAALIKTAIGTLKANIKALESLARCRMLLKDTEWFYDPVNVGGKIVKTWVCPICDVIRVQDKNEDEPHAKDCIIAKEIAGLPNKEEPC